MDSILLPSEIDFYIETMSPQDISNLGTKSWLEWHQRLQKLHQEALIEASQMKHEYVKETLVTFGKVPVLVHEAILINIWKYKVLSKLLDMDPNPANTFMAYTILYHEGVCVALLELVMFHENCCETLQDSAADLLDYSCGSCAKLLASQGNLEVEKNETAKEELSRQQNNLIVEVGLRCLTIIRYMSQYLDRLSLNISSQMYISYDVPMLFVQLLKEKPWISGDKQYHGGKWVKYNQGQDEALNQSEAQVWLTLHQLLLHPACREYYAITETRREQLSQLVMLLNLDLLDQLSILTELKYWLSQICMSEQCPKGVQSVLIEPMLDIKERIVGAIGGKFKKLAKAQLPVVFCSDQKTLMETAQTLCDAYNTDLLEKFEVEEKGKCDECGKNAIQRCSQCKNAWYCSRACQVSHWPQHKEICIQN